MYRVVVRYEHIEKPVATHTHTQFNRKNKKERKKPVTWSIWRKGKFSHQ